MQKHWKNFPKKNTLNRVLYSLKEGRNMDKIDLSREGLEVLARGKGALMLDPCYVREVCAMLAKKLLAEMDKPDIWSGAPEWSISAQVFYANNKGENEYSKLYTRTLPKSPEREIAEKFASHWYDKDMESVVHSNTASLIESAINEYKERMKC